MTDAENKQSAPVVALVTTTVVALLLYFGAALSVDLHAVAGVFARFGATGLTLLCLLSLANYALRYLRWQWFTRTLGYAVPASANVPCYLAGFALTVTPAKAGEALRCWYLKRHGVRYADSLAALFAERLQDILAMATLAGLALATFTTGKWVVIATAVLAVVAVLVVQSPWTLRLLERLAARFQTGWIARLVVELHRLLGVSAQLARGRVLWGGFALGLLAWGAEGAGLWYLAHLIDVPVSLQVGIGIYAVAVLVGAVSFLPGGLGGTEAVMALLLTHAGATAPEAIAMTLACRLATLWLAVVIGMLATGWLEARAWFKSAPE